MMLGDFKSALADSRQSIQLDSKFEKSYIRIVKCCLALGDIVGCEQAIKKLLENDPKNTAVNVEVENCKQLRALDEKAFSTYNQKDYRTALYHADGCLKYAPVSLKYKLLKAECLVLLGRITVSKIDLFCPTEIQSLIFSPFRHFDRMRTIWLYRVCRQIVRMLKLCTCVACVCIIVTIWRKG